MGTPRETFERATAGGRIPIGVVAGIAWLESKWDPAARTGRHVGLFQLVDSETDSIYGDWLAAKGAKMDLASPDGNATVAGWGLASVADRIRRTLRKWKINLPAPVFWTLVYWAWLAGTSDVPATVAAYAQWLAVERTLALLPRIWQGRTITESALQAEIRGLPVERQWAPTTISQVLRSGVIRPQLARDFVASQAKASYAEKLRSWAQATWDSIVERLGPVFERLYRRPITAPWGAVRAFGAGAVVGALVLAYLALRR